MFSVIEVEDLAIAAAEMLSAAVVAVARHAMRRAQDCDKTMVRMVVSFCFSHSYQYEADGSKGTRPCCCSGRDRRGRAYETTKALWLLRVGSQD